jgi:hypothetical protein
VGIRDFEGEIKQMSYSSESILSNNASITKVIEIIELLGYEKVKDNLKIPGRVASFIWDGYGNYESFVGVELSVYRKDGIITVETRTRIGRSYWDLKHQNKTIKYLKHFFGGSFITDEGNNRYLHIDKKPPSKLESGLFLSRWIYYNALIKPKIYLDTRNTQGQLARTEATGLEFLDQMNPRLFSNNLLIPYIVATWENYLKSSFVVLLKNIENRDKILKNARLSVSNLEDISSGILSIEEAIVEGLSFQRPKIIAENFKVLDDKIDIY